MPQHQIDIGAGGGVVLLLGKQGKAVAEKGVIHDIRAARIVEFLIDPVVSPHPQRFRKALAVALAIRIDTDDDKKLALGFGGSLLRRNDLQPFTSLPLLFRIPVNERQRFHPNATQKI